MNTPAHLLLGAAVFGKRNNTRLLLGAFLGGLLPDLSLYLMAGVSLFLLNIPAQVVFDELYFSDSWQLVFSIDNSFVIWGVALLAAVKYRNGFFIALTGSALLHLVCDFALHHDDARSHFWPLSGFKFESPFSYWDSNHHAVIVAPLEGIASAIAAVYLILGNTHLAFKAGVLLLLLAEVYVLSNWLLYF
jgi:hypothetical protein